MKSNQNRNLSAAARNKIFNGSRMKNVCTSKMKDSKKTPRAGKFPRSPDVHGAH
jgi:hypothetical protein